MSKEEGNMKISIVDNMVNKMNKQEIFQITITLGISLQSAEIMNIQRIMMDINYQTIHKEH